MAEQKNCPQCHSPLPAGAAEGLCPACLLRRGLEPNTVAERTEISQRWTPPSATDLAELFPELNLIELIGHGGMGAVYKARQKNLDRIVALKILPPEIGGDPDFASRFAREAQAMARLNHPHIVTIHDFGRRGELFFFVMEYVDGLNLRQLLKNGNISAKEALAIVPQICEALQYAHDQGIVHRDIKPENILLSRGGDVKIADFGLAKLMDRTKDVNATERVMGTPQYMAPEQTERPAEVDHRADIYALGVVFYQMLTGELPTGAFEAPSKKVVIDVRLDEVVLRALEKLPERRYQQASEVRTQLETIAATPAPPRGKDAMAVDTSRVLFGIPLLKMVDGKPAIFWNGMLIVWLVFFGITASVVLACWAATNGAISLGSNLTWGMFGATIFVTLCYRRIKKGHGSVAPAAEATSLPPGNSSRPVERQIFHVDGILKFRSRVAFHVARFGIFGGALGFLGYLGGIPGWEQCLRLFGLFGLFGLIGVGYAIEAIAQSKNTEQRNRIIILLAMVFGFMGMLAFVSMMRSRHLVSDKVPIYPLNQPITLPSFGPVIERVVNEAIDLDSGKLMSMPDSAKNSSMDQNLFDTLDLVKAAGIDAIVEGHHQFIGVDMKVEAVSNDTWNTITSGQLAQILATTKSKSGQPMNPGENSPATYAFQTREGSVGIMQVIGFSDKHDGVKIRYKLALNVAATMGSTAPLSAAAGADAALAREELSLAEEKFKIIEAGYNKGTATVLEYTTAKYDRDVAAAKVKGDSHAVLQVQYERADEICKVKETMYKAGIINYVEYAKSKYDRDIAAARLKGDSDAVTRLEYESADEIYKLEEALHKVGAATTVEYLNAKYDRDIAAARLKGDSAAILQLQYEQANEIYKLKDQEYQHGVIGPEEIFEAKKNLVVAAAATRAATTQRSPAEPPPRSSP